MNNSKLARIQAVSGLLFSLFALVHLSNTALAVLGPDVYDAFQRSVRRVYQWPALELALVVTLVVHIVSGVLRMRGRRGSKAKPPLRLGVRAPQAIRRGPGFWVPIGTGVTVIVLALLGFGGVLYEIADPFDNDFARAYEAAAAYFSGGE
ncbi:MAG: hypothetical protein ACN4G0_11245 [Polyangiales bacterium]